MISASIACVFCLESVLFEFMQNIREERFAGDGFPGAIAGNAHEELVAGAIESVSQGHSKQLSHVVGIALNDGMTVIKMPIPNVLLRSPPIREAALFRIGQPAIRCDQRA
jgi:hypothetical protein